MAADFMWGEYKPSLVGWASVSRSELQAVSGVAQTAKLRSGYQIAAAATRSAASYRLGATSQLRRLRNSTRDSLLVPWDSLGRFTEPRRCPGRRARRTPALPETPRAAAS